MQEAEGASLDMGQIEHEIENIIFPATADNTRLTLKPFGKTRLCRAIAKMSEKVNWNEGA